MERKKTKGKGKGKGKGRGKGRWLGRGQGRSNAGNSPESSVPECSRPFTSENSATRRHLSFGSEDNDIFGDPEIDGEKNDDAVMLEAGLQEATVDDHLDGDTV